MCNILESDRIFNLFWCYTSLATIGTVIWILWMWNKILKVALWLLLFLPYTNKMSLWLLWLILTWLTAVTTYSVVCEISKNYLCCDCKLLWFCLCIFLDIFFVFLIDLFISKIWIASRIWTFLHVSGLKILKSEIQ